MSDSLRSHGMQNARFPCLSPNFQSLFKLMSNESVMSSNHLILFCLLFSCFQSFPASGSFPVSQLFPLGGKVLGVSALESVLPMNTQGWFPLGLTGLITLQSKGLSSLLQYHSLKAPMPLLVTFYITAIAFSLSLWWNSSIFFKSQIKGTSSVELFS